MMEPNSGNGGNLRQLLISCGLEDPNFPECKRKGLMGFCSGTSIENFMNQIEAEAEKALIRLEQERQGTQARIAALESLLDEKTDLLQNLELDTNKKLQEQSMEIDFLREQLKNKPEKETPPEKKAEEPSSENSDRWWIRQIISMRDILQQKLDWVENLPVPQQEAAEKLVLSQMKKTGQLLSDRGVTILDQCGSFHREYQTVVLTEPTSEEDLLDRVARTVRPGYRCAEEVLRAQEVILYVRENTDVT